jgi:hypothetical protein
MELSTRLPPFQAPWAIISKTVSAAKFPSSFILKIQILFLDIENEDENEDE